MHGFSCLRLCLRDSSMLCVIVSHLFSLLCRIPMCEYAAIYFFARFAIAGVLSCFHFGPSRVLLLWHSGACLLVNISWLTCVLVPLAYFGWKRELSVHSCASLSTEVRLWVSQIWGLLNHRDCILQQIIHCHPAEIVQIYKCFALVIKKEPLGNALANPPTLFLPNVTTTSIVV